MPPASPTALPPTAPGAHRRQHERRVLRATALAHLSATQCFELRTLDISAGGMGVVAPANPRPGTRFTIEVLLPQRSGAALMLRTAVEVTHSILAQDEGAFKIGLRFMALDDKARDMLDRFLR